MSVDAVHGVAAIRLVAWREITTRVRARSFRVALLISVGAVVVAIVLPHVLASPPSPYDVELVGRLPSPSVEAIRVAGRSVDRKVTVERASSESAARLALRTGAADLVVVDGERLVVKRTPSRGSTGTFARFLAATNGSLALYAGLYARGLSPDDARAALAHPPLPVDSVLPPQADRTTQKAITAVGIIMIFVFLQQYGSWVLGGIVEEKSSRVVEVLLSVLTPRELLVGKTIGIGAVAMGHGVALAAAALVTSTAIGSPIVHAGAWHPILAMVGWFLLAYCLFCLLQAMAGALVARQEEAQNASFPFTLPLLVSYIVSVSTVFGDSAPPIVRVFSLVPLTSPVAMPARMAAGPVPFAQVVLAVVLLLASIVVAARLAAAVYERGVLQTRRLRWKDVLRRSDG
jgi:ABC-2 type transport system permease protein